MWQESQWKSSIVWLPRKHTKNLLMKSTFTWKKFIFQDYFVVYVFSHLAVRKYTILPRIFHFSGERPLDNATFFAMGKVRFQKQYKNEWDTNLSPWLWDEWTIVYFVVLGQQFNYIYGLAKSLCNIYLMGYHISISRRWIVAIVQHFALFLKYNRMSLHNDHMVTRKPDKICRRRMWAVACNQ